LRRREFITLFGGAAAGWPLTARAQQPAMPVVGVLSAAPLDLLYLRAVSQGLSEAGFVEGRNVSIEYRSAEGQNDRLPALAADLVHRQVRVIAARGDPATLAAKAATTTIPLVFTTASDPVKLGFVASVNRPDGNVTGVTNMNVELLPKRLEVLHELVPKAAVFALLINPTNRTVTETTLRDLQAAGRTLGLELHVVHASTERDFDTAFAAVAQLRPGGLVIGADAIFTARSEQLGELTVRYALPAIFQTREFAAAGGLISYEGNFTDTFRLTGVYIGRILKGEKPADLPVQQVTKVELFINMKTAKALGITVPLSLLGRADEVIE
jgi:putative ABC transport system substrate-binding protein